jgi:type VI secretion system secreted protein Hcp
MRANDRSIAAKHRLEFIACHAEIPRQCEPGLRTLPRGCSATAARATSPSAYHFLDSAAPACYGLRIRRGGSVRAASARALKGGTGGMAIYGKIKGTKQGDLKGAVTAQAYSGQIEVNSVEWGVGSPRDVATGLPTGKRVARPVQITKPMDQSSPLLHNAVVNNESLTVTLSYTVEGQGHKAFATVALTNAMIQNFNIAASDNGSNVETISFIYTKIEFTWTDGGITSTDDWMAPVSN